LISPRSKTVVIIDDDDTHRYAFGRELESYGWTVHAAANGRDGLELVSIVRPPLIFLDLQMPEPDGFVTCQSIRAMSWAAQTIIVAASGLARYSAEERAMRSGFDLYLLKPFSENLLRRILEHTAAAADLS
jgi:CheY-like chemotaxis protein